jgi:hypothetical protein
LDSEADPAAATREPPEDEKERETPKNLDPRPENMNKKPFSTFQYDGPITRQAQLGAHRWQSERFRHGLGLGKHALYDTHEFIWRKSK